MELRAGAQQRGQNRLVFGAGGEGGDGRKKRSVECVVIERGVEETEGCDIEVERRGEGEGELVGKGKETGGKEERGGIELANDHLHLEQEELDGGQRGLGGGEGGGESFLLGGIQRVPEQGEHWREKSVLELEHL